MEFKHTTEHGVTLTQSQKDLLSLIETIPAPYEGIGKLTDLRSLSRVSVIVSDRSHLQTMLNSMIQDMRKELDKWHTKLFKDENFINIGEIEVRMGWAQSMLDKPLLGLYSRKLQWNKQSPPKVYLFADNINDHAKATGKNVDNIFGYVFIHEMMHAYFDAFNNSGFIAQSNLEEPFAEFGMLTFLNNNSTLLPADLLKDAENDVQAKIKYNPREYGFGYELYKRMTDPVKKIDRYRDISNWIDRVEIQRSFSHDYFSDIYNYIWDPYKANTVDDCIFGVDEILNHDWKKPTLIVQSGIRIHHPSTAGHPISLRDGEWAITCTPADRYAQRPLIHETDFKLMMADIIKVLKREGFESYLTLDYDKVKFIGKVIFRGRSSSTPHPFVIPESICIDGSIVYPELIHPLGVYGLGNLIYPLSVIFDSTFTLTHDMGGYTLYGTHSDKMEETFQDCLGTSLRPMNPSSASTASKAPKKRFDILYKPTSATIATNIIAIRNVVLFIIQDICKRNPAITLTALQGYFAGVKVIPTNLNSSPNNIVMLQSDVTNYYNDLLKRGMKAYSRFFDKDPITLASGEVVVVSNQWENNPPANNFSEFQKAAEKIGYEII